MKCQIILSGKNKKIPSVSSAKFAHSIVSVSQKTGFDILCKLSPICMKCRNISEDAQESGRDFAGPVFWEKYETYLYVVP